MNNKSNSVSNRKSAWYLRFSTWAGLFGLMLVAIVLTFAWREIAAARELNEERSRERLVGRPVDRESLAAWYHSQTSTEGTVEWSEILTLASSQLISNRMQLFQKESNDPPFPEGSQEYYEHLKDFLREVQPLIERIRAVGALKKPVWIPIQFDEYWDRLYASRSVLQLLSLEFESAVHEGDSSRAIQSLETMRDSIAAFEWNLGSISTYLSIIHRHMLYDSLTKSLEVDLWEDAQLVSLKEMIRPLDLNTVWQKVLDADVSQLSTDSPRGIVDFVPLPSVKKQMFDQLQQSRRLVKEGYRGLRGLWKRHAADSATGYWWSNQQSMFGEMAKALVQLEDHRRLTMAAIELKRFSLEKKRLPTDLRELDQFAQGLVEFETCEGRRFDYALEYEIDSDSKAATLWCRINEDSERARIIEDSLIKKTPGLSYSVTVNR
jgi:hypothetical protein